MNYFSTYLLQTGLFCQLKVVVIHKVSMGAKSPSVHHHYVRNNLTPTGNVQKYIQRYMYLYFPVICTLFELLKYIKTIKNV